MKKKKLRNWFLQDFINKSMSLRKRDTDKKDMKLCAKKEKSVLIVKRRKRRGI